MRRSGIEEAWNALEDMQQHGVTSDKLSVSRLLMKTVGNGRSKLATCRAYRALDLVERFIDSQPADTDEVLFNALMDACCRLGDVARLEATRKKMQALGVQASPVTLGILVKAYGQAGDLQKVLQVWNDMVVQRADANAVTYGCMIDACIKCGQLEKAEDIFHGLRERGQHRNTILYTTLIKGYGLAKELTKALVLFRNMQTEGVPRNTITYNSMIDACVKCGDLRMAEEILQQVTAADSVCGPDIITYSTLVKGYCHVGNLDEAVRVAAMIKGRGIACDELVYNTLIDGCVKVNDVCAGVGLFAEMLDNGVRPSAITTSILMRLYQRAGYAADANEAVARLYAYYGLEKPGVDRSRHRGRPHVPDAPQEASGWWRACARTSVGSCPDTEDSSPQYGSSTMPMALYPHDACCFDAH